MSFINIIQTGKPTSPILKSKRLIFHFKGHKSKYGLKYSDFTNLERYVVIDTINN